MNLLIPVSAAGADGTVTQNPAPAETTVTDSVYGGPGPKTVTNSVYGENQIKTNIITNVVLKDKDGNNIEDIRPDQGSRVQVNYEWKLPAGHGYKSGAAFVFSLPDKFKVDRMLTGDLTINDGGTIGAYEVTPEGQVTFTFNEGIEDEEIAGYFYVWREFEESKFNGGTKQEIIFHVGDDQIIIPIHFKSDNSSEMDKKGLADKGMNPGEITWTVDFNKGEKAIKKRRIQGYAACWSHGGHELD
ncbi:Ig-like domain-containing protein [Paenibacillus sp. DMB20]|uniref:Ig-like domain-containing protein n=1 Tax=Paenibacillus sp. DMB20 TaxID=1642570 RepID=UPI00128E544C|nr:Ig-like domain-containing protein [Paenibacillus sp. DMB20]